MARQCRVNVASPLHFLLTPSLPRLGITRPQTTRGAVWTAQSIVSASASGRCDARACVMKESAQRTRHALSTDEKSDSTLPHAARAGAPPECAGWCACVARGVGVGVPATPLRLVCERASAEPRMHDSAGYVARASRAEAALLTDSPGTLSRRILCALTKLARRCLSDTASPHAVPSPARLPIPLLTKALARPSTYMVPYSLQTAREGI
ncbi:hypothetical protein FB451DRAFT_1190081 [Mycena latifolia]|nr:hypothetical protein FB451DRAFT_1190081 [Mycena latifolia]